MIIIGNTSLLVGGGGTKQVETSTKLVGVTIGLLNNNTSYAKPKIANIQHNKIRDNQKIWKKKTTTFPYTTIIPLLLAFEGTYDTSYKRSNTQDVLINNTSFNNAFLQAKIDNDQAHNYSKWTANVTNVINTMTESNLQAVGVPQPILDVFDYSNETKFNISTSSYSSQNNPPTLTVNLRELPNISSQTIFTKIRLHVINVRGWWGEDPTVYYVLGLLENNISKWSGSALASAPTSSHNLRYQTVDIPLANVKNIDLVDYCLTFRHSITTNLDKPIYALFYLEFI